VAIALGRPTADFSSEQQGQINYWLNGVELVLGSRLGPVSELDQATLRYVETEVVAAKVRRLAEDGATSVSVSVDDGTVTRRYESVTAADATADMWSMFGLGGASTAYTIAVGSPLDQA
jgi:hypothetical protein